jgi:transcriptional antiterminator RfaH
MWSVVQTESQRETVAAKFLKQGGFESYLPRIAVKTNRGVRERIVPLFPAYLFVNIIDRWYPIRWTFGVLRILMVDGAPAQISDKVMTAIRKREGENGLIRLPQAPGLRRGQQVRIVRGSFEDRLAIYDGMSGPDRVRILIELLGRAVPVSVALRDIAPVEAVSST